MEQNPKKGTRIIMSLELVNVGATCSYPQCNTHDFLPFRCECCHLVFCSEHYFPHTNQHRKQHDRRTSSAAGSSALQQQGVTLGPDDAGVDRNVEHAPPICVWSRRVTAAGMFVVPSLRWCGEMVVRHCNAAFFVVLLLFFVYIRVADDVHTP